MVVHLAHVQNEVTIRKVLLIVGISIAHLIVGGFDQFVLHLAYGEGDTVQVIRDIWLMVPDIVHCILPLLLLQERTDISTAFTQPIYMDRKFRKDVYAMLGIVCIFTMICRLL